MFLVLALSIVGAALKVFPSTEPVTDRDLGLLWGCTLLGWGGFLLIVYIFGQYEEVSEKWFKFFHLNDHLSLLLLPIGTGLGCLGVCALLANIPDGIIWLRNFFRS